MRVQDTVDSANPSRALRLLERVFFHTLFNQVDKTLGKPHEFAVLAGAQLAQHTREMILVLASAGLPFQVRDASFCGMAIFPDQISLKHLIRVAASVLAGFPGSSDDRRSQRHDGQANRIKHSPPLWPTVP